MRDTGQLRWLAPRLRGSTGSLLLVVIGGVVTALLAVVAAWATGEALDRALDEGVSTGPLLIVAAVLLASQLLRALLIYLRQTASIRVGTRLEHELRHELLTKVLRNARPADAGGRLATLISDTRALRYMMTPGVDLGLSVSAFVVVVLGCAVIWSPWLVLAPLVYAVGFVWFSVRLLRGIAGAARTARDRSAGLTDRVSEALHNIEAVRDAGGAAAVWTDLESAARDHRDAVVGQGRAERRTPLFLLLGVVQGIGFAHALLLARDGQLTVGDMVGYHSMLLLLGSPTFASGAAFPALANGIAAIDRIRRLAPEGEEEPTAPGGPDPVPRGVPSIEAVAAVPAEEAGQLPRIDVSLPPRSLVVVTGPTGSGKSTLLRLLAGVEPPASGSVRVGGVAATEWPLRELAKRVILVADHDSLFSMTLEENIGLGRLDADPGEIGAVADRAMVSEFARSLPDGLNTLLGAEGTTLSGGQKQRIALARALLSRADVLLLDDPFSALDAGTSRALATGLIEVSRDRTVVVVSDRSDLRAHATHVLHLDSAELTVHRTVLRDT
ncbi:ABC transporter ATP-binding protein [Streptomyces sp. NBRC 109706]|uniref:ABC transporter ATP-binding protein n=1 Tax=Streptomyces sp. NBRC 109706 TaxID=1550035 RepID=UPI0007830A53|nr:ABC transporter ATP-binding protein [Streptomyces sp. NBRC 109706]